MHAIHHPEYCYEPSQSHPCGHVTFQVLLDSVTYRRYANNFQLSTRDKNRGLPPKGWRDS